MKKTLMVLGVTIGLFAFGLIHQSSSIQAEETSVKTSVFNFNYLFTVDDNTTEIRHRQIVHVGNGIFITDETILYGDRIKRTDEHFYTEIIFKTKELYSSKSKEVKILGYYELLTTHNGLAVFKGDSTMIQVADTAELGTWFSQDDQMYRYTNTFKKESFDLSTVFEDTILVDYKCSSKFVLSTELGGPIFNDKGAVLGILTPKIDQFDYETKTRKTGYQLNLASLYQAKALGEEIDQ